MANIRIYDLAKKLGKSNKEVLAVLQKAGIKDKTHSSTVDSEAVKLVQGAFGKPASPAAAPKERPAAKAPEKAQTKEKPAAVAVKSPIREPQKVFRPAPQAPPKGPAKGAPQRPPIPPRKKPLLKKGPPPKPAMAPKAIPEEEEGIKDVAIEEGGDKFQVRPGMKKAFKAIRKIEHRKWQTGPKKHGKDFRAVRAEKLPPTTTAPRKKFLKLQEGATVKEFAELISMKFSDVIKKFMELGYAPTINQPVDTDAAVLVAENLGVKLEVSQLEDLAVVEEAVEDSSKLSPRPPVVTIMGHVDHGKTSLLDAVRESRVMDSEAGGITQHIGAYKVSIKGKEIVFLDTPGHEAFTAMRARGAKVTDIVVLIVAADDGVKPQTIEAIDHAKAANVPIIVAINKIDKPGADPSRVRAELSEQGIVAEDWGGQNIFAEISAKQRIGIDNLLELILLQAEMLELKANPERLANGVIIEARIDRGRGPIATVLVQGGKLNIGDIFLCGVNYGRVRALFDDKGKKLKQAGPSTPVEVLGFGSVPAAGDTFVVMEDEKKARQVALARIGKLKTVEVAKKQKLTLDDLYQRIKQGDIKDLNIIVKGDVQGSVEAIKDAFREIKHPEVQVRVIHSAVGGINESDVMLAAASNAIIIGFSVRPDIKASHLAESEGVDIELYNIIYEAIEDVKKALEGMLEPTLKEKVLGRAEVRQVYFSSKLGAIAGCMVVDGMVSRNCDGVRVIRDNIVVYEGKLGSLKRFKEDAKEVQSGYECGIMVENFNDVKVGDIIENFLMEKVASKL